MGTTRSPGCVKPPMSSTSSDASGTGLSPIASTRANSGSLQELRLERLGLVGDGDEVAREERLCHARPAAAQLDLGLVLGEEALVQHAGGHDAADEVGHRLLVPSHDLNHVPHAHHLPACFPTDAGTRVRWQLDGFAISGAVAGPADVCAPLVRRSTLVALPRGERYVPRAARWPWGVQFPAQGPLAGDAREWPLGKKLRGAASSWMSPPDRRGCDARARAPTRRFACGGLCGARGLQSHERAEEHIERTVLDATLRQGYDMGGSAEAADERGLGGRERTGGSQVPPLRRRRRARRARSRARRPPCARPRRPPRDATRDA